MQFAECDPAVASHWVAVSAPSLHPWYVLRMRLCAEGATHPLTILLAHDHDVLDSIEELAPVAIDSLICLVPPAEDQPASLRIVEIGEIWVLNNAPAGRPMFVECNASFGRTQQFQAQLRDGTGWELFARIGAESFVRGPVRSSRNS
jgi:hypothetical protein